MRTFENLSFQNTNFSNCKLIETDFVRADLRSSKFIHANLYGALLDGANLSDAEMMKANLWWITLVETKMRRVNISGCKVYGVSPWNVDLEGAIQNDLDISRHDEERLTVDDLEVAHFTYLSYQ